MMILTFLFFCLGLIVIFQCHAFEVHSRGRCKTYRREAFPTTTHDERLVASKHFVKTFGLRSTIAVASTADSEVSNDINTDFSAEIDQISASDSAGASIENGFYDTDTVQLLSATRSHIDTNVDDSIEGLVSRRDWLATVTVFSVGTVVAGLTNKNSPGNGSSRTKPMKAAPQVSPLPRAEVPEAGRLEPLNLTKVAAETNINVTMDCPTACRSVDDKNFTKLETAKTPAWLPKFLSPSPKIVKVFPNSELLLAATIAGSTTEMLRTSILYPLQTVKTRVQRNVHNFTDTPPPLQEQVVTLGNNVRRYVKEGNLYAGIAPSLLVSVPATGVYYGVRDVTKRMLSMTTIDDVAIALAAAFVADVISLSFRTPADALALRLQAQDVEVGDWVGDSLKRLPAVIATDLPYLLSKITLNRLFIHGSIGIGKYAEFAMIAAIAAAFLTTPFDVARTRMLVDSDGDPSNGLDGGRNDGVIRTMKRVTEEGQGGVANLFAGWLERVLYLGIGRAWLEPIQIIGYVGIRDTVLLEWF